MEPSPSLDANIVLRNSQGESHFGARVVIDPGSGALRTDHLDAPAVVDAPPEASLRSVSGRWLFDASAEGRIFINGVPVQGARIIIAGDVITIAGSVLLAVLGLFALLRPIALELQPADADVRSLGSFSWQSASSVFVFPGEHTLRAERKGYEPAEVKIVARGPVESRALIHLVKLPGKLQVDSGGVNAEISA